MGGYEINRDNLLANLPRTAQGLPRAGNVVIHEMLGEGGMAAVYLGFDENLAAEVAVKVLPFKAAKDASAVERFFREARSTFKVDHQNVVRVLTVGEEAGTYYLVMEFVDGESADALLKREGPLPERDALEIVVATGEALAAAHAKEILHRDVKPANIMIRFEDGRVKLADLGLAKALGTETGGTTGLTATGQMLGTPAYMSPEQAQDASQADERTDIYSLGATLYALLSGKAPFESSQLLTLLMKVMREEPEDLRKLRPGVAERTAGVVKKLTAKDLAQRPQSMKDAVELLRGCLEAAPTEGARGLARPEMTGRRRLKARVEEPTPRPAPPAEMTLDDVTPESIRRPGRTPAAVAGMDDVAEKQVAMRERRAGLEAGDAEEAAILQAVDRDIGIATTERDPATALAAVDLVCEELDALEERRRVVAAFDRSVLERFSREQSAGVLRALAAADGKLRSGRPREAKEAYSDLAPLLSDAASGATERRQEYDRLSVMCLELRTLADSQALKARGAGEHANCLRLLDSAERALELLSFDEAESLIREASQALRKTRATVALRRAARKRFSAKAAVAAVAALALLGLILVVAGRVKHNQDILAEARSLADAGKHEDALKRLDDGGWLAFGAGRLRRAVREGKAEAAKKGASEVLEALRNGPVSKWAKEADYAQALAIYEKANEAMRRGLFEEAVVLYGRAEAGLVEASDTAGALGSEVLAAQASARREEAAAERVRADRYAGERYRSAFAARRQAEEAVEDKQFDKALELFGEAEEGFDTAAARAAADRGREEADAILQALKEIPRWNPAKDGDYAWALTKRREAEKALVNGRCKQAARLYTEAKAGFEMELKKAKSTFSRMVAARARATTAKESAQRARESARRAEAGLYAREAYRSAFAAFEEAERAVQSRRSGEAEKLFDKAGAGFVSAAKQAEARAVRLRVMRREAQAAREEADKISSDKYASEEYRSGLDAWEAAGDALRAERDEEAEKLLDQAKVDFEAASTGTRDEFRRSVASGEFEKAAGILEIVVKQGPASAPTWFKGLSAEPIWLFAQALSVKQREGLLKVLPADAVPERLRMEFCMLTQGWIDFKGQQGGVNSLAFSPDRRYLATGGGDGTAVLWDLLTGNKAGAFRGHESSLNCVAFSPDGISLAAASHDGTAALWQVSTGKKLRAFEGHERSVSCLAFSSDGRRLATGSWDRTVALWDVSTGKALKKFKGHRSMITSVAFSPDVRSLVAGGDDGTVAIYRLTTGKRLRSLKCHRDVLTSIAFSPCGRYIATASDDRSAALWEVSTGRRLRAFTGHAGAVKSVAFSRDGRHLATGSLGGGATLWEAATGGRLKVFTGPPGGINSVALSPDGRYLAGGSSDSARLWLLPEELWPKEN